jgi:hypothetical protein
MFRCIYSLKEQESSTGEHILQNFLGARWTSDKIVSDDLQRAFGHGKVFMPCFDGVRDYIKEGIGNTADYIRWYGSTELPNLPRLGPADQHISSLPVGRQLRV